MSDLTERVKAALTWDIGLDTKTLIRDLVIEIEHLHDELAAWKQRHDNVLERLCPGEKMIEATREIAQRHLSR